jgi:hypothetical protein
MITPDEISAISNCVTAFAAIVAGVATVIGLATWKKQLKGQTEYELAKRYLKSALKLREAIRTVRNPWITPGEKAQAIKDSGIDQISKEQTTGIVYQFRWKRILEALTDLEAEALEAEAIWGKNANELIDPLLKCVGKLSGQINIFLNSDLQYDMTAEDKKEIREIIYDTRSDKPNAFTEQVDEAIKHIELYIRPHLRG